MRDNLLDELKGYSRKEDLNVDSLEVIEAISTTVKNLDKIIDREEGGYSNGYAPYSYDDRRMSNNSYARGRGTYAKRDSMGRYSSNYGYSRNNDGMITELSEMAMSMPDEHTRQQIQSVIERYR
jgi:hypothetical protein